METERSDELASQVEESERIFSKPALARIKHEQTKWEASVLQESLEHKLEVKDEFKSGSGDIVKRLYTPGDIADTDYERDIGFPGQPPFTRGIRACGYRTREELLLSFYTGYGSAENANQRYRDLIAAGAGDIWFAMDLPTQLGYDSDNSLSEFEVGKAGVALDTLRDLEILLDGIPLDKIRMGAVANSIGPWFLAMFIALIEKRGTVPEKSYVWIQNDPFKEYTGRGTYIFSPAVAVDLAADATVYCCNHMPMWDPQYAVAAHLRSGCTAAQEIGFGVAHLVTYIDAALKKGVKLEQLLPRLSIHYTTREDFFEEVAKFRAARRLWAKVARERFKTSDPRVLTLRQTTYTSTRLPAKQPLNNIVRTTVHVLASLLGGVEHILSPAYDEALALPTLESTRLAALTRNIIHCELFVNNTVDPLGGSYFVEKLTNELEEKGRECFEEMEAMGGPMAAIEGGFYQRVIAEGIFRHQQAVESGERVVIGVNKYTREEGLPPKIFHPDPGAEVRQIEQLREVKRERDNALVEQCLAQIKKVAEEKAAGKDSNIMPSMLNAVKAYATIGEIHGVLRQVFGEYKPSQFYI